MPTLIRNVTFAQAFALLQRFGYWLTGQRGSHVYMTNADGNDITLVNHGNRPISAGTMGKIAEQAGIDPDHFLWGLGRADRNGRSAPRGWRPGFPG